MTGARPATLLILATVLGIPAVAGALDRPVDAVKLVMKRSASGREKLVFVSKDPAFLVPAVGSAEDPTSGGASLRVVSMTEGSVTVPMPAGTTLQGWRLGGGSVASYRFKNRTAPDGFSIVRTVTLREGRGIKLTAKGTGLALTAAQGSVGIRFTTGGLRNCALFDAPTIVRDEPNRFEARGAVASALANCQFGEAPVCGNGVVEPPEECEGGSGPGIGCGAPGTSIECKVCGVDQCRFPGPIDVPCCGSGSGTACVIEGPHYGGCYGPGCRDVMQPCAFGFPQCCPGLVCVSLPVALEDYCLRPSGAACGSSNECASQSCVGNVCS